MVTETKPRTYSEDERRQIIEMHLDAHDGVFLPHDLLEEAGNLSHPAHDYFEWDNEIAGYTYRIWQARRFAQVRIIHVPIAHTNLAEAGTTITVSKQPIVVSPLASRNHGGGYVAADSQEGQHFLLEESEAMGRQWLARFRLVLTSDEVHTRGAWAGRPV